jgi:lysophospholipase
MTARGSAPTATPGSAAGIARTIDAGAGQVVGNRRPVVGVHRPDPPGLLRPGCGLTLAFVESPMDLIALAKNPVPSGATAGYFKAHDGINLRFARWEATRGPRRGTVCVFQGRGEFIEKYFEVVADLRRRGFTVATMDWRGQGGSDRLLSNPRKGHVRSFADFDQDLARFMKEVVLPDCQPPFIALAHSMGGHILLRNASAAGSFFSRMVLSAPMISINPKEIGIPAPFPRIYCEVMGALALGRLYTPGGNSDALELEPFEGNPLTSDRERYTRNSLIVQAAPQLGLGSPTISWLRAALRSINTVTAPDYPTHVKVPLLLFAAGMDRVVSTTHIEEFAVRLKVGTHVLIPQARHEILQETDEVRKDFWAAFDAYLGVDTAVA